MKRAAIYARMSTDKQSEDSPADQVARCRQYAERHGLQVVEDLVQVDAGISGASRHNRPGLLYLLDRVDRFDVLLVWDGSRVARNLEDLGHVLNLLDERGREAIDVSTGQSLGSFGSRVLGVVHEDERRRIAAWPAGSSAAAQLAPSPTATRCTRPRTAPRSSSTTPRRRSCAASSPPSPPAWG